MGEAIMSRFVRVEGVAVPVDNTERTADFFSKGAGTVVQGSVTDYGGETWVLSPSGASATIDINRLRFNGGPNDAVSYAILPDAHAGVPDVNLPDDYTIRWFFAEAQGAGYFYLIARYTDVNNYIFIANSSVNSSNWTMYQVAGGVQTAIGSGGSQNYSHGIAYDLVVEGDQVSFYRDGVLFIGPVTTAVETGTGFGVAVYKDGSGNWDNMSWGSVQALPLP